MSTIAAPRGHYQQAIAEDLATSGYLGMNPSHVEAFMRIEHGTLDALSPERFRAEVRIAAECVQVAGPAEAEALAASYGL